MHTIRPSDTSLKALLFFDLTPFLAGLLHLTLSVENTHIHTRHDKAYLLFVIIYIAHHRCNGTEWSV